MTQGTFFYVGEAELQNETRNVIDVECIKACVRCKAVEFVKGFFLICNLQNYVGEQKFSYNTSYAMCCISTLCTFIIPLTHKTGKTNRRRLKGLN